MQKITQASIYRWIDKDIVVCMCVCVVCLYIYLERERERENERLFSFKEEWNPAICDVDGPWEHYAKWNKSEKERQILMISLI